MQSPLPPPGHNPGQNSGHFRPVEPPPLPSEYPAHSYAQPQTPTQPSFDARATGSVLGDFFRSDWTVWRNIFGLGVAGAAAFAGIVFRSFRREQIDVEISPESIILFVVSLIGVACLGASCAALHALYEVTQSRIKAHKPVSGFFMLLFGDPTHSLLLIWGPLLLILVTVGTIVAVFVFF